MHSVRNVVRRRPAWTARACLALAVLATAMHASSATAPLDPKTILQEAKNATGGTAWDPLISQHSRVHIASGDRQGTAERWASLLTGRSRLIYSIGGESGVIGYDGFVLWTQNALGQPRVERDPDLNRLAINTAFRDRLAFWYPDRQAATFEYKGRERADNADFDVVRITPEGGLPYEVWVSATTHRIERMREPDATGIRTEVYSDFRDVQGVRVPFTVQTSHGDPKLDERYTVDALQYNIPLDRINFEPPK